MTATAYIDPELAEDLYDSDDGQYTFGEHIAQVLANLGLLATTNPEGTP